MLTDKKQALVQASQPGRNRHNTGDDEGSSGSDELLRFGESESE